jgi:hypothetical protein
MVSVFVNLLRKSFDIDESKLRIMMQLHEYHNESETKQFWSVLTGIPKNQFSKTYLKPHTKKRIRLGYMGCIRVRYYDAKIALELRSLYNSFANSLGT